MDRLPVWFNKRVPAAGQDNDISSTLRHLNLHTICESGRCPNIFECSPEGVAFLIMGNICTRNCRFCCVSKQKPLPLDPDEPTNITEAARTLGIKYVFVTSVTRDDIPDGGASHFAATIKAIKQAGLMVEVLIPDFKGNRAAIETVVRAAPEVIGHNMETVPRLYPRIRPMADYSRSLDLLAAIKEMDPSITTKSGLMLGMGETREEVVGVMRDLREAGCDLFTLGQYLAPSPKHYPVQSYPSPEEFSQYEPTGIELGFKGIVSAPLWRSSYKADVLYYRAILEAS